MRQSPRDPQSSVLDTRHTWALTAFSLLIAGVVLGAFLVALGPLGLAEDGSVTVGFLTLAFSQIWHVFNMRSAGTNLFKNDVVANPWVWGAIVLCIGLIVAASIVPGVSTVLSLAPIPVDGWILAVGASLVPLILGPLARRLVSGRGQLFVG